MWEIVSMKWRDSICENLESCCPVGQPPAMQHYFHLNWLQLHPALEMQVLSRICHIASGRWSQLPLGSQRVLHSTDMGHVHHPRKFCWPALITLAGRMWWWCYGINKDLTLREVRQTVEAGQTWVQIQSTNWMPGESSNLSESWFPHGYTETC